MEAEFHREQPSRERDRSQLLLQVNNTLVSNLSLRELVSAISGALSTIMPHEAAVLTLYDESRKENYALRLWIFLMVRDCVERMRLFP